MTAQVATVYGMRNDELQAVLKGLGMSTSGTKYELIARLEPPAAV